jgi:hypothetical protein
MGTSVRYARANREGKARFVYLIPHYVGSFIAFGKRKLLINSVKVSYSLSEIFGYTFGKF